MIYLSSALVFIEQVKSNFDCVINYDELFLVNVYMI